jgi:hypothetical protein
MFTNTPKSEVLSLFKPFSSPRHAPHITNVCEMSDMRLFSGLFSCNAIRMTRGADRRASSLDLVMCVTGHRGEEAERILDNIRNDIDPSFFTDLKRHRFPGRAEREQFVLVMSEMIELVMMLPGESASKYRLEAFQLVRRVKQGDLTLLPLLEKNRLSEDGIHAFARAELKNDVASKDDVATIVHEGTRLVSLVDAIFERAEIQAEKKQEVKEKNIDAKRAEIQAEKKQEVKQKNIDAKRAKKEAVKKTRAIQEAKRNRMKSQH